MKAFFAIVTGLLLWILLAGIPSIGLHYAFNLHSGITSGIFIILLYLTNLTYSVIFTWKQESLIKAESEALAEMNKYLRTGVNCFKCRSLNNIQVQLDTQNSFECSECGALNKVIYGIKAVHPASISDVLDMEEEIINGNIES